MENLKTLSNHSLIQELRELIRKERHSLASIIKYLHEVDLRKLYIEMGYSSLFAFCTECLGYSEGAAYRRIQAARCLGRIPEVAEKLESGAISLCAVSQVARVEPSKQATLITQSEGRSKEEVERLVAPFLPVTARVKESVRVSNAEVPALPLFTAAVDNPPAKEIKYTVTLELSNEEFQLLEEVQRISGARKKTDAVLKALKLYKRLKSPERNKRKRVLKPTGITSTVKVALQQPQKRITRHIPNPIRDKVLTRDHFQCTFVSKDGYRCEEKRLLQLDHIKPFSIGGEHSEDNLRVMCPAHNRFQYDVMNR